MTPVAETALRKLDERSKGCSFFHKLHPLANFISCILFIVTTVSYGKYSFFEIVPLALYPLALFYFCDIPAKTLFKAILPVIPFIAGIGLFNPLFEKNIVLLFGHCFSAGWVSFSSLLLKGLLCASTALLTVSVTGASGVSESLRIIRAPVFINTLFVLIFRYIETLAEEAGSISLSYSLRSGGKTPGIREWGVLAGSWLLRTLKRADRVYSAMVLRGFNGSLPYAPKTFVFKDFISTIVFCGFFAVVRFLNIPQLIGGMLIGG